MTKEQLEAILDRVRTWPRERQEEAAAFLLMIEAEGREPYVLSPEEEADLDAAEAEIERGDFASEDDIKAIFKRFR